MYTVKKHQLLDWAIVAIVWTFSACVSAQPLEEINLQAEADTVIATISLSGTVSNVHHSPANKGLILEILLDIQHEGSANDSWVDNDVRKSPPSTLIPSFTIKTNLKNLQPKLVIEFSREAEYTVSKGSDGRSILVSIKIDKTEAGDVSALADLPEIRPLPEAALPPATDPDETLIKFNRENNQQAQALMIFGRKNLAGYYYLTAVDTFNQLLLLPQNDYTQDAQEWIGVARERAGQLGKARQEYESYLQLYPKGIAYERVKIRLSKLGSNAVQPSVAAARSPVKKQENQTQAFGSLSMYYYTGASKIDTVSTFGNTLNQSTFSAIDQSALITSADATARFTSEEFDNRIVFRDTAYSNFLPGQTGKNKLNAAYIDVKNKLSGYSARLGRQTSNGGGVLGRYDGATVGLATNSSARVNLVAGQLSDYTLGSKPEFFGTSLDMGLFTLYAINQTVDGVLDRRAVGTEIHYFQPTRTAFAVFDYDISYALINTAMFQGTISPSAETTYNLLLDHRKSPYVSTRNALYGSMATSVQELLQIMSENELRALAAARTGSTNLAQLGVSQQVSEKLQVAGDVRVSNFEGLPASGTTLLSGQLAEVPSTDNEWATSIQLIGNSLLSDREVSVLSLSYIKNPMYRGLSAYIYDQRILNEKWSLNISLQLYKQETDTGTTSTRVMPNLRVSYQMRQQLNLELEAGIEASHSDSVLQSSEIRRQFLSFGFRWDF